MSSESPADAPGSSHIRDGYACVERQGAALATSLVLLLEPPCIAESRPLSMGTFQRVSTAY